MNERQRKEALSLALTIRAETQPTEGHNNPGAVQDCWRFLLEILEDGKVTLKRNAELDIHDSITREVKSRTSTLRQILDA